MMKRIAILLLLLSALGATAQNIEVKSFTALTTDLTATSLEGKRIDQNGQVAALIKIVTTETGFTFEGGALGIVDSKQENGEVWVWVPKASRKITIKHPVYGVLRNYIFPVEIGAERTYEMILSFTKVEEVVKEEKKQYLIFHLNPKDASLEVDDKTWKVDSEGSAMKYVDFGTYSWRVQAPNYHPDAGRVTIDDPDNAKTITVTLRPNFGWIEVTGTGNLLGANVFVDNKQIGKAPCKSEPLKSGMHSIRVEKNRYYTYNETVTVRDGETTTLSPVLQAEYVEETPTSAPKSTFTRGKGFVIRPELYNGLFGTIGYQFSPRWQISTGVGVGIDGNGGYGAILGLRMYTSDTNWTGMFDYHFGAIDLLDVLFTRHTLVAGASYKDFDFGVGLIYLTTSELDGYNNLGLSLCIGYNIRCYKHRK